MRAISLFEKEDGSISLENGIYVQKKGFSHYLEFGSKGGTMKIPVNDSVIVKEGKMFHLYMRKDENNMWRIYSSNKKHGENFILLIKNAGKPKANLNMKRLVSNQNDHIFLLYRIETFPGIEVKFISGKSCFLSKKTLLQLG